MTDLDPAALRADAVAALARVLRAPDAKPADALRAAELLLRPDTLAATGGSRDATDATDAELLDLARGVGGPERGPAVPATESVPSHAPNPALPIPKPATPIPNPVAPAPLLDAGSVTLMGGQADVYAIRESQTGGPKEDPPIEIAPGGPKEDPPIEKPAGGPKKDPPIRDPWGPPTSVTVPPPNSRVKKEPEPWE